MGYGRNTKNKGSGGELTDSQAGTVSEQASSHKCQGGKVLLYHQCIIIILSIYRMRKLRLSLYMCNVRRFGFLLRGGWGEVRRCVAYLVGH